MAKGKSSNKVVNPTNSSPVESSQPLVEEKTQDVVVSKVSDTPVESESAVTSDTTVVESQNDNVELLFNKLIDQFQDITSVMKTLQSNLNILKKEVLRERKEDKKKIEKTKNKKSKSEKKAKKEPSGFANASPISDDLSSFLGLPANSKVPRTEVTSKLYAYVKDKNLQNPENKKQIIPDEALLKLINPDPSKPVTFFNIQAYIKHHFLPNTGDSE